MIKKGAIILAGGNGERFGGKKQFCLIDGKPLWRIVYDKVYEVIKDNIVVVGVDVESGVTRTMSVVNGINALDNNTDRVIILEAARPLVTIYDIYNLLNNDFYSVSLVKPLVNTVVYRNVKYINRNDLYELLTPQAFNYKMLFDALNTKKYFDYTDETRIMFEHYGIKPYFIETRSKLMKVTYKEDLEIIRYLYHKGDVFYD